MAQAYTALTASPGARLYYDHPARQRRRPQRRPPTARQPPRRRPSRMPQDPHPLRRDDGLAPARSQDAEGCRLTIKPLGSLLSHATAREEPTGWHVVNKPGCTQPAGGSRASPSDLQTLRPQPQLLHRSCNRPARRAFSLDSLHHLL
jgi:hypothetical protein